MRCPLYEHCGRRLRGDWCSYDNRDNLGRLLDEDQHDFSRYEFIKNIGSGSRVFQNVEMLAEKFLERGGVHHPPVPIGLAWLADEEQHVEIRNLPLVNCHGALWRLMGGWLINLRGMDSLEQRRFTIFHEVFHILAHCKAGVTFRRSHPDVTSHYYELLADYFALSILLPSNWIENQWVKRGNLDELAKLFVVPKSALYIRMKLMGLL